jgi:hypothetical protein
MNKNKSQDMKRLILVLIFLPLTALTALCQQGLHINEAFDGRYSKEDYADQVTVAGDNLLGANIKYYRALTVANTDATNFIRNLVVKDGVSAQHKEVTMRGGKLAYGFYQLPPQANSKRKRYIFFFENKGKGALIYMEGNASMQQLKNAIMNK